jgi:hypothetical protein
MELDADGEEHEEEEEGLLGSIGGPENGIFNLVYTWRKTIVYFTVLSRNIQTLNSEDGVKHRCMLL